MSVCNSGYENLSLSVYGGVDYACNTVKHSEVASKRAGTNKIKVRTSN